LKASSSTACRAESRALLSKSNSMFFRAGTKTPFNADPGNFEKRTSASNHP
jgi:hypothetical protein